MKPETVAHMKSLPAPDDTAAWDAKCHDMLAGVLRSIVPPISPFAPESSAPAVPGSSAPAADLEKTP